MAVGILERFVFRTTTLSDAPRASAGFDAREAAALRLNHLNIAQSGKVSRRR